MYLHLYFTHLRNWFCTAVETVQATPGTQNNWISSSPIRNRLRDLGLRPRRQFVPQVHIDFRSVACLTQHRPTLFLIHRSRNAIFFDESSGYLLYRANGRQRICRRTCKCAADNWLVECRRFGGGGVHRTPLVYIVDSLTAQGYVDIFDCFLRQHLSCCIILRRVFVPFVRQHNVTFQQDDARAHVALY